MMAIGAMGRWYTGDAGSHDAANAFTGVALMSSPADGEQHGERMPRQASGGRRPAFTGGVSLGR